MREFRSQFAVGFLTFGIVVWCFAIGFSLGAGIDWLVKHVGARHEVPKRPELLLHAESDPGISPMGQLGAEQAVPVGAAHEAYGVFLDGRLQAIVAVWSDGQTRIITRLSPEAYAKAIMEASKDSPHVGVVLSSQCRP